MKIKYSLRNIAVFVLIVTVIVLATIHVANPSLLRSAASSINCSGKEGRLNYLLGQDQFKLTGNVADQKQIGDEINSIRKELHHDKCWTDEQFHLSIARQAYRLYLGSTSWMMAPISDEERKKQFALPNFSYMQQHLGQLSEHAAAHESEYKCAVLNMQTEENMRWLAEKPFGTSAEGKKNEELFRVAMTQQMHEMMVSAKCLPPVPSVQHMISKHR